MRQMRQTKNLQTLVNTECIAPKISRRATRRVCINTEGCRRATRRFRINTEGCRRATRGVRINTEACRRTARGFRINTEGCRRATTDFRINTEKDAIATSHIYKNTAWKQRRAVAPKKAQHRTRTQKKHIYLHDFLIFTLLQQKYINNGEKLFRTRRYVEKQTILTT